MSSTNKTTLQSMYFRIWGGGVVTTRISTAAHLNTTSSHMSTWALGVQGPSTTTEEAITMQLLQGMAGSEITSDQRGSVLVVVRMWIGIALRQRSIGLLSTFSHWPCLGRSIPLHAALAINTSVQ